MLKLLFLSLFLAFVDGAGEPGEKKGCTGEQKHDREMSVQPHTEGRVWCQSYELNSHSPSKPCTTSSKAVTMLRTAEPSPTVVKIMNLPVAAKLVIFKKYFYVF